MNVMSVMNVMNVWFVLCFKHKFKLNSNPIACLSSFQSHFNHKILSGVTTVNGGFKCPAGIVMLVDTTPDMPEVVRTFVKTTNPYFVFNQISFMLF